MVMVGNFGESTAPAKAGPPVTAPNPFVGVLDLKTGGDVGGFLPDWLQNVPAYIDGTNHQNWFGAITTVPIKFAPGDNLMGPSTNFDCPVFTGGAASGALELVIHDLIGANWIVLRRNAMAFISATQLQAGFDSGDIIAQMGADIVVQPFRFAGITTTAGGIYVVSFRCLFTGGTLS